MKISVYIISHNQKDYLKPAIESVLNQTLRPSQILIIDNNSSDGSQELIKSFCSKHSSLIEAIYNDKNKDKQFHKQFHKNNSIIDIVINIQR